MIISLSGTTDSWMCSNTTSPACNLLLSVDPWWISSTLIRRWCIVFTAAISWRLGRHLVSSFNFSILITIQAPIIISFKSYLQAITTKLSFTHSCRAGYKLRTSCYSTNILSNLLIQWGFVRSLISRSTINYMARLAPNWIVLRITMSSSLIDSSSWWSFHTVLWICCTSFSFWFVEMIHVLSLLFQIFIIRQCLSHIFYSFILLFALTTKSSIFVTWNHFILNSTTITYPFIMR